MKKLFSKTEKMIVLCSVLARAFGLLGAAGCFTEGHPYIATMFIVLAGAAMELKDQISKKQNPQ